MRAACRHFRLLIVLLVGAATTVSAECPEHPNKLRNTASSMTHDTIENLESKLAREWVEIREKNIPGSIFLRTVGPDIPPARGRRRLDLRQQGNASGSAPGPDDALESEDGSWSITGQKLEVHLPGWSGTYIIEELSEQKLVLKIVP